MRPRSTSSAATGRRVIPTGRTPKVHVTPHIASATNPRTASPAIIENIKRLRSGQPLILRVNPKTGY
jgi:phosphoglycerate dehydrogenase-like enzyme